MNNWRFSNHTFRRILKTFTCSKPKMETLSKGVKYVQKLTIKTTDRGE